MLKITKKLIFGEKNVHLQDFGGREIRTFQKSDFLISGGRYRVTESLLGKISGKLLIEINVPIEVEVTFEAQINANVKGAIAHAKVRGAEAHANARGAEAHANAPGAIAYANADRAIAYATVPGALAIPLS